MEIADIISQLTPGNRKLAETLIKQLAEQDGIRVDFTQQYPEPINSIPIWVASLVTDGKSPRTIEMYEQDARNLLKKMPQPTFLELQQYFAARLQIVTPSRISSEQKAMKSLFKYLHKHGLAPNDPTKDIKTMKDDSKEVEMPTQEQITAALTYTTRRKLDLIKYKTMLILLISTGLRIEEACSLERNHINFTNMELKAMGKGHKERIIPLTEIAGALLYQWIHEHYPGEIKYVFASNTKTGYWHHSGFRDTLRKACTKAGAKPIHPHQLRHYFATKTLEDGAKLEVISKILGHADVAITARIYRHIQVKEFHRELANHSPLKDLPLLLEEGRGNVIDGEFTEIVK